MDRLHELILEEAQNSRYSSGCHQDILELAATLLVEQNEKGYSCICSSVSELSASKVRASKACLHFCVPRPRKSKLGFVDGTCVKSSYKGELEEQWKKCNAIVLSWIGSIVSSELMPNIVYVLNMKKVWSDFQEIFDKSNVARIYHLWSAIATLRQCMDSVTSYYTKMKDLWDELDVLAPISSCDCEESRPSVDHLKNIRLLKFLMGLNESFSNIRSYVLGKRPVVTVNEAYAIVSQEESQRTLGVIDTHRDPLTMLACKGQDYRPRKPGLICDYCGYKGHEKENYFKIIGYPRDFKSKRKNQTAGGKSYANNANANTTTAKEEKALPTMQTPGQFFTKEQYKQLVNLLSKPNAGECSVNMTGIISLLSIADNCDWVIDSGVTHHVTFCKDVLKDIKSADSQGIQGDLYSARVMWIGKEHNELYLLKENITLAAAEFFVHQGVNSELWHMRLGHVSIKAMENIPALRNKVDSQIQQNCEVYPLAKQLGISSEETTQPDHSNGNAAANPPALAPAEIHVAEQAVSESPTSPSATLKPLVETSALPVLQEPDANQTESVVSS
ncbi:uncharacterized protein [Nicotiana sylvestris]|uniref:uncharacterized protein n=1 Tax=Nicotiana sylvestris TaxID=4096 RepID=UPI00388C976B